MTIVFSCQICQHTIINNDGIGEIRMFHESHVNPAVSVCAWICAHFYVRLINGAQLEYFYIFHFLIMKRCTLI